MYSPHCIGPGISDHSFAIHVLTFLIKFPQLSGQPPVKWTKNSADICIGIFGRLSDNHLIGKLWLKTLLGDGKNEAF